MCSVAYAVKPSPQVTSSGGQLLIQETGITSFKYGMNHEFDFHVFNSTAGKVTNLTGLCQFHIYNRSGNHIVTNNNMEFNSEGDFIYNYNGSTGLLSQTGTYSYIIWCTNNATNVVRENGFSEAQFYVTYDGELPPDDLTPIAIIICIPLVLALLCMLSIVVLGEGHAAFKVFLYIASFLSVFVSYNYAIEVLGVYYNSIYLQNFVAGDYVWYGYIFYVIVVYFIIYWIIQIFDYMAGKKKAKMRFEEYGQK